MPDSMYARCETLFQRRKVQVKRNVRQRQHRDFGPEVIHHGFVGGKLVMIYHEFRSEPAADYFQLVRQPDGAVTRDKSWALVYKDPMTHDLPRGAHVYNATEEAVRAFLIALER